MDNYVVGLGEVLWDMLPGGKKIGGAPANFAYHVSQFGLHGCVASAVGRDALGDEIVATLRDKGLDSRVERVDFPTGVVMVELDGGGVPRYDIKEGVAWDNIPFTPALEELARHAGAVCFGSLAQRSEASRSTVRRFLDAMPAESLVVFDVNLRQHFYCCSTLVDSMRRCNVLKLNDEELPVVCGMLDVADGSVADRCHRLIDAFSLDTLVLTCGAEGSWVFTSAGGRFLPTPKVAVADTVGAGDSFTAAFVATLLRGGSVEDAHTAAVSTAAYVCSQDGAMPVLPADLRK